MGTTNFDVVEATGGVTVGGTTVITSAGAVTADIQATAGSIGTAELANDAVTEAQVADSTSAGGLHVAKSATVLYDFSVDGGTAGTIALTGSPTIPDNAAVWVEAIDVITTCTSSTDASTIALQLPTDGALTTAIAISDASNPWDVGVYQGPLGGLASATPKKTTAARVPSLVVAGGENVTAGKIVFYLRYFVTE